MSLSSALLTATSGLRLTTRQLEQSAQNIANADTAGYTRKTVSGEAVTTGGVRTGEAQRAVDTALRNQALKARSAEAGASLANATLSPLAGLQGDTSDGRDTAGLISALNDAFTALAASPADSSAMSGVLRAAEDIASQLNTASEAIGTTRQAVQDGLVADVDAANGLIRQIGALDKQIRAEAAAGRDAAALKDQRDTAIGQLSDYLGVKSTEGADGGVTLTLASGSVLPLDAESGPLGLERATVTPGSYHGTPAGTLPGLTLNGQAVNGAALGGRLGAGFTLRDQTLPTMQAELDQTAATLAGRLDEQGLRLFTDSDGSAPPAAGTAAGAAQTVGFAARMTVNAAVAEAPRLLRDGTHATADFTPNPAGGPSGFTTLLSRVSQYSFGAEKAAGVPHTAIPTSGLGPGGTLSSNFAAPQRIIDYAASVVGSQAGTIAAAESAAEGATTQRSYLDGLVQKSEGVDTDAELANMVALQNAYSANARVMSAVQSMWDALLDAVR
ncbi:flagellar hook-associated protein FlgK [Pseudoroseomonas cervicalis]|uniref:Flagellar hook-associated protein 1 n=1 Tax=Pseudoroseomonas cervicalis ATCC 49957 TaxID=525371 RepID=D5RM32_9PROT|nr:flagellar hook-associated protein FlgK [Pseudoroseomonas cervicalis]EFH11638.1 flagellar hook-associated protein FlgK [Pseudoroseomonas cervicalis ATCC 49957]